MIYVIIVHNDDMTVPMMMMAMTMDMTMTIAMAMTMPLTMMMTMMMMMPAGSPPPKKSYIHESVTYLQQGIFQALHESVPPNLVITSNNMKS